MAPWPPCGEWCTWRRNRAGPSWGETQGSTCEYMAYMSLMLGVCGAVDVNLGVVEN